MGKAILLVDMPSNCRECPFYDTEIIPSCWAKMHFTGRTVINDELLDKKQFCPLKPMPKKKNFMDEFMKVNRELEMLGGAWNEGNFYEVEESLSKQIRGYNFCIDEILGEEE